MNSSPDIPHLGLDSDDPLSHDVFEELGGLFIGTCRGDFSERCHHIVRWQECKADDFPDNVAERLVFEELLHQTHRVDLSDNCLGEMEKAPVD